MARVVYRINPHFYQAAVEQTDGDDLVALSAAFTLTSDWANLEDAIAAYQANDGVYLVTESNYNFDDHSSTLNALPSLSEKVDSDLWLSVVMVAPENMEALVEFESQAQIEEYLETAAYMTPLNGCGELAADYCIVTPSYSVVSTMTETVAQSDDAMYAMDDRTYQSFDGHSMGAPMVAATLALMEEENQRSGRGYSMKELVKILKSSANRSFPGYNRKQHGVGMLDAGAAIAAM